MRFAFFTICIALLFAGCEKVVENVSEGPVQVYPNPFQEQFSIYISPEVPATADIHLKVLDGSKKPIIELDDVSPTQSYQFNMEDEKEGVYFLETTIDGERYTQQILKFEI